MEEKKILKEINTARDYFNNQNFNNRDYAKFTGAITIEVIREHLKKHKFLVSNRDVFIRGIKNELDLIILRSSAIPQHGILYEPSDVIAVLEIKYSGAYGEQTITNTKNLFKRITQVVPNALCCYLTLLERESYRHRITPENIMFPAYSMFLHRGNPDTATSTGDWGRFLEILHDRP